MGEQAVGPASVGDGHVSTMQMQYTKMNFAHHTKKARQTLALILRWADEGESGRRAQPLVESCTRRNPHSNEPAKGRGQERQYEGEGRMEETEETCVPLAAGNQRRQSAKTPGRRIQLSQKRKINKRERGQEERTNKSPKARIREPDVRVFLMQMQRQKCGAESESLSLVKRIGRLRRDGGQRLASLSTLQTRSRRRFTARLFQPKWSVLFY